MSDTTTTTETVPKVLALQNAADVAYAAENQAWFDALPTEDLTALWALCCTPAMPAFDDEVYDALAQRGWFDTEVVTP